MSLLQLASVIALRRIISSWRLELILLLGIVLAVALMSSGVAFSDLLAEAALRRTLNQAAPEEANFSIRVYNDLVNPSVVSRSDSVYQSSLDFVDSRVAQRFESHLRDEARLFATSTFFFRGHPQLELDADVRPRGKINFMSGLLPDRIEVVEGRWPYSGTDQGLPTPGEPLEVAIDTKGAELLQLHADDGMEIFPAAELTGQLPTRVEIVGVFRRVNTADEFWYGAGDAFSSKDDLWTTVPLFTKEDAILQRVGGAYPGMFSDVTWFFFLDRQGVRAGEVGAVQDTLRAVRTDLTANLSHSSTAIRLDSLLDEHEEQLLLARIPLFLMVSLVTGILLYYLALVAAMTARARTTEISILKSRGSTTFQIGVLALVEGLLLAIPAVALGPLLALGVSRALGRLFFDLDPGSGDLNVAISTDAIILGVGGALLAVAVLTISTLVAARHGIVEFRQAAARPPSTPFIHRYYLDIMLLALIGLIWWQVQSRGSFLVRPIGSGSLEMDFTLLVGPVLLLLALGLVVLRFFPIIMNLLARVAEPLGPAWLMQGLRRVSRDPIMPGTLVVLLMPATAIGIIGSAFSSTLERSQEDRALYEAGADMRIEYQGDGDPVPLLGLAGQVGKLEGVNEAAEVERISGSLETGSFSRTEVSILAVDSGGFADVSWHRPDLAGGKSMAELMRAIAPGPSSDSPLTGGIELSREATHLSLWANPGRADRRTRVLARLQDARGYYFDVLIGELGFREWRRLEARLSPLPTRRPRFREEPQLPAVTPPFTLLSLRISTPLGVAEPGIVFFGELAAVAPDGNDVLASFQTLDGWHVIEDYFSPGLYALESSGSVAQPGTDGSAAFSWASGGIARMQGIRPGGPERPMPAVVSKSFLEAGEARLGDTLNLSLSTVVVPIQAVAVADYFPTLGSRVAPGARVEPFLVVDLKTLTHYRNRHGERLVGGSNELWMSLDDPGAAPLGVTEVLKERGISVGETRLASEMVSRRVEQPLVNAGWGGILVLMFLALVLASASGVMLFSYLDTRERKTEFALLRTLGLSRRQLNGVVWLNLLLVVAFGIGLGTLVGRQIVVSLLPLL